MDIVLEKNDVIIFLETVEVDVIEGFRGRSAIQVYKSALKIILIKVAEKKNSCSFTAICRYSKDVKFNLRCLT